MKIPLGRKKTIIGSRKIKINIDLLHHGVLVSCTLNDSQESFIDNLIIHGNKLGIKFVIIDTGEMQHTISQHINADDVHFTDMGNQYNIPPKDINKNNVFITLKLKNSRANERERIYSIIEKIKEKLPEHIIILTGESIFSNYIRDHGAHNIVLCHHNSISSVSNIIGYFNTIISIETPFIKSVKPASFKGNFIILKASGASIIRYKLDEDEHPQYNISWLIT